MILYLYLQVQGFWHKNNIFFLFLAFIFFNKTETYMLQICFPKSASGASTPKHEISDIESFSLE